MVHPEPLATSARPPGSGGRAGQVVLSVLGVVLMAVCGLVVTVVLLLTVGVERYLVGLLAASLPVAPLVAVYLWLDRNEPEPVGLLLFAFGWGASVATAGALLLSLPPTIAVEAAGGDATVVGAVLVAPVVEEVLKALGLGAILLVGRRALDGLVDGFVYAGMVGIGFAFTENILYLGTALLEGGAGALVATFLLRGVVSPFAHPLFTAAAGVGIVYASRRHGPARWRWALGGLVLAIVLHGLWNAMAVGVPMGLLGTFGVLWLPLFVVVVLVARHARSREAAMIRRQVGLYARHGWFTPAEARMLASLPARRAATAAARRQGGPARRSMAGFQLTAVRLAHLRQRIEDGTAPWDAADRERELLDQVNRHRGALLRAFPGGPGRAGLPA